MIECRGLTHRYGPLTAVSDLSFRVERGEILGLLGPNGAGKSTTMKALVGLLTPTEGEVRLGDADAVDSPRARAQLGYLPEAVPLYRDLTVREFLSFAARVKGVPRNKVADEVDRLVEACGLETVISRLIGFCSRGFRQRIGLAQALAADPEVLVLDEPTVGLDPAQVVDIRETIRRLSADKAVVLSTHILPEASLLCHRVLILNQGRCMAVDTPDTLSTSMTGSARMRLGCGADAPSVEAQLRAFAAIEDFELVSHEDGRSVWTLRLSSRSATSQLVETLVRHGCSVEEIRPERLALEEVYLELVREEGTPA